MPQLDKLVEEELQVQSHTYLGQPVVDLFQNLAISLITGADIVLVDTHTVFISDWPLLSG